MADFINETIIFNNMVSVMIIPRKVNDKTKKMDICDQPALCCMHYERKRFIGAAPGLV